MTTAPPLAAEQVLSNPYAGPEPLGRHHRLYGRDDELAEIEARLVSQRIVVLQSVSGMGKTSLLEAGLIPRLECSFEIARVRGFAPLAGESHATIDYAAVLARALEEPVPRPEGCGGGAGPERRRLLVLDQFEELWTHRTTDWPAKRRLLRLLAQELRDEHTWAIISLREEFLSLLLAERRRFPGGLAEQVRLEPLRRDDAAEVMVRHAAGAGVDFEAPLAVALAELLSQVEKQTSRGEWVKAPGDSVEPMHLQLTCYRLWEAWRDSDPDSTRLTLRKVRDLGLEGVTNIEDTLSRYYDDVVTSVSREGPLRERAWRDWFERDLISEHGVRRVAERPVGPGGPVDVRDLGDGHLIRQPAQRRKVETWELAHDLLVGAVRTANARRYCDALEPLYSKAAPWLDLNRPRELLCQNRAELRACEQAAGREPGLVSDGERSFLADSRAAVETLEAEQAQRRKEVRNKWLVVAGVAVALIGFLIGSILLFVERDERQALSHLRDAMMEDGRNPAASFGLAVAAAGDLPRLPVEFQSVLYGHLVRTPATEVLGIDGPVVAVAGGGGDTVFTAEEDGTIRRWRVGWNATEPDPVADDGYVGTSPGPVRALAAAADGNSVAAVIGDGTGAQVWQRDDAGGFAEVFRLDPAEGAPVIAELYAHDGDFLARGENRVIRRLLAGTPLARRAGLLAVAGGSVVTIDSFNEDFFRVRGGGARDVLLPYATAGAPTAAALTADGRVLALGFDSGMVKLLPLAEGSAAALEAAESHLLGSAVRQLAFTGRADGWLVGRGGGGDIVVWQRHASGLGERARVDSAYASVERMVALAPARALILTDGGRVERWVLATGHAGAVTSMAAFDAEDGGRSLLTGGADGGVRQWFVNHESLELVKLATPIVDLSPVPDEASVAALSSGGEVALVGRGCGDVPRPCPITFPTANATTVAASGETVYVGDADGTIWRRAMDRDEDAERLWPSPDDAAAEVPVRSVELAELGDGTTVLVALLADGRAVVLDPVRGTLLRTIPVPDATALEVWRADADTIADASDVLADVPSGSLAFVAADTSLRLVSLEPFEDSTPLTDAFEVLPTRAVGIAYDEASGLLATLGEGGFAYVWDPTARQPRTPVSVARLDATAWTAVSLFGDHVAVGGTDGRVRLLPRIDVVAAADAISNWTPSPGDPDCARASVAWHPACE